MTWLSFLICSYDRFLPTVTISNDVCLPTFITLPLLMFVRSMALSGELSSGPLRYGLHFSGTVDCALGQCSGDVLGQTVSVRLSSGVQCLGCSAIAVVRLEGPSSSNVGLCSEDEPGHTVAEHFCCVELCLCCSALICPQNPAGGMPGLDPGLTGEPPSRKLWLRWRYSSGIAGMLGLDEATLLLPERPQPTG